MDNDDQQRGRILSRREILTLLGAASAAVLAGCAAPSTGTQVSASASTAAGSASASQNLAGEAATAANRSAQASQSAEAATAEAANTQVATPSCVVRPEVTEGPYYVNENLMRSDVREDRQGTPLALTFAVSQVSNGTCSPLQGATVEIWHCDAAGQYSDVSDPGFNTAGQKWLRGAQTTDANGIATFTLIFPGWYSSRAVHIHFKVHPNANQVFTSQLFFPDEFTNQVFTAQPYAAKGQRDTLNSTDNIYQDLLLLSPTHNSSGIAAMFPIGIDLSTVGTGQSQPGGGPGGGGPGGPRPSTTTP